MKEISGAQTTGRSQQVKQRRVLWRLRTVAWTGSPWGGLVGLSVGRLRGALTLTRDERVACTTPCSSTNRPSPGVARGLSGGWFTF